MIILNEIKDFKNFAGILCTVKGPDEKVRPGLFPALEYFIRSIPGPFVEAGDPLLGRNLWKKIMKAIDEDAGQIEMESSEYKWLEKKFARCGRLIFAMNAEDIMDAIKEVGEEKK